MKPKVDILLAMYKPKIKWLRELLISLNNQDYENIELIVWNDSPNDSNEEEIFLEIITKFPYRIIKGTTNLGSNGAFEQLTKLSTGKYVAYCDQDDIWLENKISYMVNIAEQTAHDLYCSDMYVIDSDGLEKGASIKDVRPHHCFYDGDDQFSFLLLKNFVTGCTTLVKRSFALGCLPFPKPFVHDWWLALKASEVGSIAIINKPLIKYRIHGNNQTGTLYNVYDKDSYIKERLVSSKDSIAVLLDRINNPDCQNKILKYEKLLELRIMYINSPSITKFIHMVKSIYLNKSTIAFEICIPFIPNKYFKNIINLIKEGKI